MKKRILCVLLALFMLLALGACGAGDEGPELQEPVTIGSDLATAEIGDLYDGSVLEGNVLPEIEELSFSAAGRVGEICVVLGDQVKKGDPLIRLDVKALKERMEDLEDRLEYARKMDEFDTREAELNRRLLVQQVGEYSTRCKLYDNDQAKAAQRRAAQIAQLEEQLAEAEEDLNEESVIYAPCDGSVAAIRVSVGDYVQLDQIVAVVADDASCYLQTDFISESAAASAKDIYAMVGGVRYEVSYLPMDTDEYITLALSGADLHASFALKGGKADLIGQYALLYVMTVKRENVLNVPVNAILRDASGNYVYVDHGGERIRREVEIGLKTAAQAEILSGLEEGENVYVVG